MRRRLLPLLLVLSCTPRSPGQPAYAIESVTFAGSGFRAVELDGYGTAAGPHWPLRSMPPLIAENVPEYYRLHGAPIAYLGGSVPEAALRARVPGAWTGAVQVSAEGGGLELRGEGRAEDGALQVRVVAARALPAAIIDQPDVRLRWRAQHGGRTLDLGTSRVQLYVLLAEPRGPLLHTPLHLATQHAPGARTADSVLAGVWSAFARRDVRRARDARPLRYYGEYLDGAPAELRRLLVSGTGQCVAWSHLLHAALAAHGIDAEITGVQPPASGHLFLGQWRLIDGSRFIDAGANGVVETEPAGDDVAYIGLGRGVPHSRIWAPEPLPIARLAGDDTAAYLVGENGLADTPADTALALPLIARGFGLEQQRAYQLEPGAHITLRGDDVIAGDFVLTGANGVLETERQPGMRPGAARGSRWDPVVGRGSTQQRVQGALPRAWPLLALGGDDRELGWRLTTGEDGVSQTRGARYGQGLAHAAAIGAGANYVLDTRPRGDDQVIDLAALLPDVPPGHSFVAGINAWPEPGLLAQQNRWPPTEYPLHVLVRVGDRYFDPSFGAGPYASPVAWEQALLAAVSVRVLRDGAPLALHGQPLHALRAVTGDSARTRFVRLDRPH